MSRSRLLPRILADVALSGLLAGPALASGLAITPYDQHDVPLGSNASPMVTTPAPGAPAQPVADPNNAPYQSASATFATGATVVPGRALYPSCPASGTVTMTLSGGGSLAYPVTAGGTVLPFAVVQVSADTAGCTHQNIQ